jgi:hypothetical protein
MQKVEPKNQGPHEPSGRWTGSAAVALRVIRYLVYDRWVALSVPVQTLVVGSKRKVCAAMGKY